MTLICVGKLTIIDSDNGLSPERRQAIIWTNAGILLIGPLGTNFNEILISIQTFSFKKMHLKMSSAKWRPFCLGLNVLNACLIEEMDVPISYNQYGDCWLSKSRARASAYMVLTLFVKNKTLPMHVGKFTIELLQPCAKLFSNFPGFV